MSGIGGKGIGGLPSPLNSDTSIQAGGGTATATIGGVLNVNTTQYSTPADTTEHDAISYTIPANTLNSDGKSLRVKAFGTMAANANVKSIRIRFDGVNVGLKTGALNNTDWFVDVLIIRSGVGAQKSTSEGEASGVASPTVAYNALTSDETTALIVKVTAQNGTAAAADIVVEGFIVEILN